MCIDAQAVVDPTLKVYGVSGLRVADASIMPTLPSANTNAACCHNIIKYFQNKKEKITCLQLENV